MRKIQIDVFKKGDEWCAHVQPCIDVGELIKLENLDGQRCRVTLELKEEHHHDCTTELELKNAEFEARYAESPKDL